MERYLTTDDKNCRDKTDVLYNRQLNRSEGRDGTNAEEEEKKKEKGETNKLPSQRSQKEHEYPANKRHRTPGKKRDERRDDVSGTGVALHRRNYVNPRTYVAAKTGIVVKPISPLHWDPILSLSLSLARE